jgi:cytochrome P450
MSDQQLRDEDMTMLVACHESTPNALSWTFYLLSQSRVASEKLRAELDRGLADRLPPRRYVPSLPYTWMVIEEAMQLYSCHNGARSRSRRSTAIGYEMPCSRTYRSTVPTSRGRPREYPDRRRL